MFVSQYSALIYIASDYIHYVKEIHIGSAVTEILLYKQTDRQVSCYFIIRIIYSLGGLGAIPDCTFK